MSNASSDSTLKQDVRKVAKDMKCLTIGRDVNGESGSQIQQQQAKKNRRKLRKKKDDALENVLNDAKIEAVAAGKLNGTVIRKRTSNENKQINLHSFKSTNEPYVVSTTKSTLSTLIEENEDVKPKPAGIIKHNGNSSKNDTSKIHYRVDHSGVNIGNKKLNGSITTSHSANSSTTQSPTKSVKKKRNSSAKASPIKTTGFEPYTSHFEVQKGLADGSLMKGVVRINPKFFTEAYVSQDDKSKPDYLIGSVGDRNRALEGDVVVLKMCPEVEWKNNQKRVKVVHILEKVHPRVAVGYLSVLKEKRDEKVATFQPRDKRVPRMNIIDSTLPKNFFRNPEKYEKSLFIVEIVNWDKPNYAFGAILQNLGKSDNLKAETNALLFECQLDFAPFPPDIRAYLPKSINIPSKELAYREDFRKECVFTIDPLTAKDLDDAMSCKRLPNGNFEIGVHIADVSYHLAEKTPLDEIVCRKATTIYLVDNVFHMLPVELCNHCSLLPGRDNLTFSVIWEISSDAEIISKRFVRTVINSCSQLAYEHAQKVIENPSENFNSTHFPHIHNSFTVQQICTAILDLQSIAVKLREKRISNGALRIDQVKLGFALDATGNPLAYNVQEIKEANWLIEEFMLLANISVAEKIYEDMPNLAFLRCHEAPNERLLKDVQKSLEIIGVHINISSSAELNSSLAKFRSGDYLGFSRHLALNHLLAKPMIRAAYFCAQNKDPNTFQHFALSIPIYTHFTSPIRRYADIMVHRLLAACLGYAKKPKSTATEMNQIADNCNRQKYNAKRAGELSSELFLAKYVEKNQPFITDAVVVGVQEKSFDAVTIHTGTLIRIYTNNFEEGIDCHAESYGNDSKQLWKMNVIFPRTERLPAVLQIIELFQLIQVALKRKEKTNKLEGLLVRPSHLRTLPPPT